MIMGTIQKKEAMLDLDHHPNTSALKYVKQVFIVQKEKMDSNAVMLNYFNNPLSETAQII